MLPGPVKLQVTPVAVVVKFWEPLIATFAEFGLIMTVGAGVGVGVGGGVLWPPPHATIPIKRKQTRNAETILVIRTLHPCAGKNSSKYRPSDGSL
jgi:hypothetical protein